MVRQLRPWFENLGKRQVKAPKVYVRDTGLLHVLLGISNRRDLEHHPLLHYSPTPPPPLPHFLDFESPVAH